MTYTPMADLKEFHDTFAPHQRSEEFLSKTERRINLICEEYEEVAQAIIYLEDTRLNMTSGTVAEATEELAKELADLLYVVYGTAEELGIPLEEVFKAVHESNMSKVWPDGEVHYNEFGKVLKPSTYSKPDLSFIHDNRVL
jgi:predicted HAD superfamily Cof-like phosphohydrolase